MASVDLLGFIIFLMCAPMEFTFNWAFGFVSDILKVICVSMLVISIAKYLGFYERKTYLILKILLYIWFLIYLAYVLEYFKLSGKYDRIDWISICFSALAPLCMLFVWVFCKKWLAKRLPFDVYYIIMTIYLAIGIWWSVFKPDDIDFSVYFVYWLFLTVIGNYFFSLACKGVISKKDDKFWKRVFVVLKIIAFTLLVAVLKIIVFLLKPEENLRVQAWWFGLGGIVLFGVLSILFYSHKPYSKLFVLLMLGSESLLFVDIRDFFLIFVTPLGVLIFMAITFCIALLLYFYTERAKSVGIALFIAVAFSVAFLLFVAINDERLIENWAVGISFAVLFIILYLLPPGKLWMMIKRFHLMWIIFFISLFLLDLGDYLIMVNRIYF